MSWSLGEIQALTIKAARGAGYPWGVADEAGWAVRWLSSCGLPGADAIAKVLESPDGDTCPLTLGIAVADAQQLDLANGKTVAQPLIILPFLGRAAGADQVQAQIEDLIFNIAKNGTDLAKELPARARLNLSKVPHCLQATIRKHRIEILSADALAKLQGLAQRTYAPATEASRISGAGAGLTDND